MLTREELLMGIKKYTDILDFYSGKTLSDIVLCLGGSSHSRLNKGASGLIVENLLGLENNQLPTPDIADLEIEIKVLPVGLPNKKAKEPTQIKMINYMNIFNEDWSRAEINSKIKAILWVAYGVYKLNSTWVSRDKYILLDWYLDIPDEATKLIFKRDWELIRQYVQEGRADTLSCSMGAFIEPKTKGKNNLDVTDAPDGRGGLTKARRRAYYFKKLYTNTKVIPNLRIEKTIL